MEVLAGMIIGILVTIVLLKYPITININKKFEEIKPIIPMPDLATEMNKKGTATDKIYEDDMKGLLEDVNNMMLGGKPNGKATE